MEQASIASMTRTVKRLEAELVRLKSKADADSVRARIDSSIATIIPYVTANMKAGLSITSMVWSKAPGNPAHVVFAPADDVVGFIRTRLNDNWQIENINWIVAPGAKPRSLVSYRPAQQHSLKHSVAEAMTPA